MDNYLTMEFPYGQLFIFDDGISMWGFLPSSQRGCRRRSKGYALQPLKGKPPPLKWDAAVVQRECHLYLIEEMVNMIEVFDRGNGKGNSAINLDAQFNFKNVHCSYQLF